MPALVIGLEAINETLIFVPSVDLANPILILPRMGSGLAGQASRSNFMSQRGQRADTWMMREYSGQSIGNFNFSI